ncbi:MAG: exodeoxyribonuclease VII small subunit [Nanoarchaeota archaeon]|jgi:exodeoxyribonuclease VII small subunit|nr:exodeoxyribonuclease VII small subunit [Nanoarchaeota archaeon]
MEKEKTFEAKLEELNKFVEELEDGEISLDKSMSKYKDSISLIKQCQKELDNAELKIEKL